MSEVVTLPPRQWTQSELLALRGSTVPRLWTPPLRELTEATSEGWDVIRFAEWIGRPLDPWQQWLVIHALELYPDGRPRFRQVLTLVARQAGKTELLVVLSLYWLFLCRVPMVLGTSTKLEYAAESWHKACALAKAVPVLAADLPKTRNRGMKVAHGFQELATLWECRYKIAAANETGGRSLSIDRLIEDELRQHKDWEAHSAAKFAMNAIADAQAWAISNQGDVTAVVLESLRNDALTFIETGEGDERLGLFEWSTNPGLATDDPLALVAANPQLGRRMHIENLIGEARLAARNGGAQEAKFRTEVLCERVRLLNPAIDPRRWINGFDPGTLDAARRSVALCIDVSPDLMHATLVAAAVLADGRVRVEVVESWSGMDATHQAGAAIPDLLRRIRPRVLGWIPGGPAAALAATLKQRKGGRRPPAGVKIIEIGAEAPAICMGLAALVNAGQIAHSNDPLINAHLERTTKHETAGRWIFVRAIDGHIDASYGVAGAAHLARTLPRSTGRQDVVAVPRET